MHRIFKKVHTRLPRESILHK